MKLFNYEVCAPTLAYFVIVLIISIILFLLDRTTTGFSTLSSQFICLVICSVILAFICSLGKESGTGFIVAWIFAIIYICSASLMLVNKTTGLFNSK
ncbi:hypothetical protein Indivirus_2_96 [Indivirus ILV1]|uniref:Uncharacterized protein n=1 Tax=Indivirus ILV1 TaxID=1977633 RepID=A0A1V0SDC9_9VIRU|nr:hypothetical protein Indivirus_2_96 [Indivirus ILV1]